MAERKCTNEFCEHDHVSSPEKRALLTAIREAATLALNSVYGTDDRHEYMALRIADSAVNGTPLPWKYEPPHTHTFMWRTPGDNFMPPVETARLAPCPCGFDPLKRPASTPTTTPATEPAGLPDERSARDV